jgi:hypothetical protein
MAAPTFQINESNGSGQTVTANVPQTAFASVDSASTSGLSAANPISQGNNSYEKWSRVAVVTAATTTISSLSVYFPGSAVQDSSGSTSTVTLKFGVNASYATPTASTSSVATTVASTVNSAPGTTVTAPSNTVGALSGYVTEQLQTTSGAAGGPCTFASPYRAFQFAWS